MMRKILRIVVSLIAAIGIFIGCNARDNSLVYEGVVINGVRWATRNVGKFGTFVENPEDMGMLYQWNRRKAWSATNKEMIQGWDSSVPRGETWRRRNDPCPRGWRVPTPAEFQSLIDTGGGFWTAKNGVSGRLFGTIPNQIFLPAAGFRNHFDGVLNLADVGAGYWSSKQRNNENAIGLWSNSDGVGIGWDFRTTGRSIRCVAR